MGFDTLGLADDEFPTEDRLPFIPYHRESRRIHGAVRFTLNDITDPYAGTLYRTAVGVGDYPVDQHHTRYSGWDELPDLYFHPIPSYGFPLGIVIPAGFPGLLVAEKSVSVTNLVNGSTRLQPVVLQIGQQEREPWRRWPQRRASIRPKSRCAGCRRRCSVRAATCCRTSTCRPTIRASGRCSGSA